MWLYIEYTNRYDNNEQSISLFKVIIKKRGINMAISGKNRPLKLSDRVREKYMKRMKQLNKLSINFCSVNPFKPYA